MKACSTCKYRAEVNILIPEFLFCRLRHKWVFDTNYCNNYKEL